MKLKTFFALVTLFSLFNVYGQDFTPRTTPGKLTIESASYPAHKTYLDFDHEGVERAWWKFAKGFGRSLNMRKYYQTTIPPGVANEGTVAIVLLSKSIKYGQGTMFYLALDNDGIPDEKEKEYLDEVRQLLYEFKLRTYVTYYEERLETLEKKLARATRKLDRSGGNVREEEKWFREMEKLREEREQVREALRQLN